LAPPQGRFIIGDHRFSKTLEADLKFEKPDVPYCRLTNIGATTREVYYRSSEIFQNSGR
jgi:hypothetical protein